MRFSILPALSLVAAASAQSEFFKSPLIDISDYLGLLQNFIVAWDGHAGDLVNGAVPLIIRTTSVLRAINQIAVRGNQGKPLSEEEGAKVIQALEAGHDKREGLAKIYIERKAQFKRLNVGFVDVTAIVISVGAGLTEQVHAAVYNVVPDDQKGEVQRLLVEARETLDEIRVAYGAT